MLSGPSSSPTRRRLLLIGAAAGAVVLISLSVLHLRPPSPADGAASSPGAMAGPPSSSLRAPGSCRPAEVYPLQCGTYQSTFGGEQVTGSHGGPREDPVQISFAREHGELLLLADGDECWSATVPMRLVEDRTPGAIAGRLVAERAGSPRFTTTGCGSRAALDGDWAYGFLRSALVTSDAESFGQNETAVFFQYQGLAPIGQPQLARNDLKCVPAHVAPFTCGTYRSISGTGSLSFLGTRPFRLAFAHDNGSLTASFFGRCNAMSAELQPDDDTVVATGGATTAMGCFGVRAKDDDAVELFFRGVITCTRHDGVLVFASPRGSATFQK